MFVVDAAAVAAAAAAAAADVNAGVGYSVLCSGGAEHCYHLGFPTHTRTHR